MTSTEAIDLTVDRPPGEDADADAPAPPRSASRPTDSHIAIASGRVGHLEARAASHRGVLHAAMDEPRQDAFALQAADGRLILGVADGVGSCPHSADSARLALDLAVARLETMSGRWDEAAVEALLAEVADAVRSDLADRGRAAGSGATTLTLAVIEDPSSSPGARPSTAGITAQVVCLGDSPAMVLAPDGTWSSITAPERGSNVLRSYVPDALDSFELHQLDLAPGSILVLATDGFSTPLGDGTRGVGPALASRWLGAPRGDLQFAIDLAFDGYHDDRTVVAAWIPERAPQDGDEDAAPDRGADRGPDPVAEVEADPATGDSGAPDVVTDASEAIDAAEEVAR